MVINEVVVRGWDADLESVCAGMDDLFARSESRELFRSYVRGLLAEVPRKKGRKLAVIKG